MSSRTFVLAVALAGLFSFVLGFLFVAQVDSNSAAAHWDDVQVQLTSASSLDGLASATGVSPDIAPGVSPIVISDAQPGSEIASATQVNEVIEQVADDHGVTIVRFVTDPHAPETRRTAYVYAPADSRESRWLQGDYPDFTPDLMRTQTRPLADCAMLSASDVYTITGASRAARKATAVDLANRFAPLGYGVTAWRMNLAAIAICQPPQLLVAALLALLMCALLSALSALLNAQGYAVLELHGYGAGRMWRRDIAHNRPAVLTAICIEISLAVLVCWRINHFAQWKRFLAVSLLFFLIFLVAIALFHIGCLRLCTSQSLVQGLKGAIPLGRATLDMYIIRVPAALVAMTTVSALMIAGAGVGKAQTQLDYWGDNGDVAYVEGLRGSATAQQDREYLRWLAGQVAAGQVIRSYETTLANMADPSAAAAGSTVDGTVLIANTQYLQHQVVKDCAGNRISSVPYGTVLILVPEERAADRQAIAAIIKAYVHKRWETTQLVSTYGYDDYYNHEDDASFATQPGPAVSVATIAAGQQLFDYRYDGNADSTISTPTASLLDSPIIVAMDASAGVDNEMDYSTEGMSLFFTDESAAWASLKTAGLDTAVSCMRSPTESIRASAASRQRDLYQAGAAFLLGVLVLAMSGIALASTHVRGRSQEVFVTYVHGWSFWSMHRRLILCETALFGAIAINGVVHYHALAQTYDPIVRSYAFNPAMSAVEVAVVCALSVAVCLIATARFTHVLCAHPHEH